MAHIEHPEDHEEDSPTACITRLRDHFAPQPIFRDSRGRPAAFFGVTDFTIPISAHVIEDMASAMVQTAPLGDIDIVVSIADRSSGALAHAVALRLGIPYSLANWYPIGSPGEVAVENCAGFSGSGVVYLNGVKKGKKVGLVMDVLKTGTTALNLAHGVINAGATITCCAFGCELLESEGREKLKEFPVFSMVPVHLRGEMTKEGVLMGGHGSLIPATVHPPKPIPCLISEIKKLPQDVVDAKMERVARTFVGIPIMRNPHLSYPYSFFTLTDFVPALEPQLVEDMADLCVYYGDFTKCDVLVSEADRGGGPLIQAVAMRTNLPYVLANWYPSGEGVGASSAAQVGFSGEGSIVVNGIKAEDRCIFVDDMLSSGGTAEGVLKSLVQLGGIPVEGVFISEKLYPPKNPGELPVRKGMQRLNAIFPHFKVTTVAQFIAEGDTTKSPPNRVGEF